MVPIAIPDVCCLCFQHSFGVNFEGPRHYRPEILRRASDHGIGRTAPESRSRSRRSISASQAASASWSSVWSRLSRRAPASAALPSGGSLSASLSRLLGSCFIAVYYTSIVATFNLTGFAAELRAEASDPSAGSVTQTVKLRLMKWSVLLAVGDDIQNTARAKNHRMISGRAPVH
jgi:hypothetical protein